MSKRNLTAVLEKAEAQFRSEIPAKIFNLWKQRFSEYATQELIDRFHKAMPHSWHDLLVRGFTWDHTPERSRFWSPVGMKDWDDYTVKEFLNELEDDTSLLLKRKLTKLRLTQKQSTTIRLSTLKETIAEAHDKEAKYLQSLVGTF
jgi:hypothetical protein